MAHFNPYAAPSSDAGPGPRVVLDEDRVVTPEIMEAMQQTRPWVVFLAVLGFIAVGLMVIGGLAVMGTAGKLGNGMSTGVGLGYLGVALLYVFPSLTLLRYGGAIKNMLQGQGVHALTEALRYQKSFWRFTGVATLVVMSLYLVGGVFVGLAMM